MKGYQEADHHALHRAPTGPERRRGEAAHRALRRDERDPSRLWPRTPRRPRRGAGRARAAPSAGDGKARPRSAAAVFPDMDAGRQGVPRLAAADAWTAPEQKETFVRPPSRPQPTQEGGSRRRRRGAAAAARRSNYWNRSRRCQDAEVSRRPHRRLVAVQLPPPPSRPKLRPTPQLARPATAGGPSSLASDSLLSWQPSLFIALLDAPSTRRWRPKKARTTGRGGARATTKRRASSAPRSPGGTTTLSKWRR